MLFSQVYDEAHPTYTPIRGYGSDWHVWGPKGALKVLLTREYEEKFAACPTYQYVVNFANSAYASIAPGDPLWPALLSIAEDYEVAVFPTSLVSGYRRWTGAVEGPHRFDAIRIMTKEATKELLLYGEQQRVLNATKLGLPADAPWDTLVDAVRRKCKGHPGLDEGFREIVHLAHRYPRLSEFAAA